MYITALLTLCIRLVLDDIMKKHNIKLNASADYNLKVGLLHTKNGYIITYIEASSYIYIYIPLC